MILHPAKTLQEAESHGQPLQEAIFHGLQSQQEARDHGQSRRKPDMTDSLYPVLNENGITCLQGRFYKSKCTNVHDVLLFITNNVVM